MYTLRTAFLLALSATLNAAPALAQDGQPATGATTTFQIELTEGSNLVSLPALPDSMRVAAIVADVLPHLTFVQDDAGRYFIPVQGIDGIGAWRWDEAYRIEVTAPTSFFVQGAAIQPEASPILVDGHVGNWVPYFRREPMAVEDAFAAIASSVSRVEAADGRFYQPGDASSSLDSLRTGRGYRVWVSQPVTLTYPANPPPPDEGDATPPAAPAGLTASAGNGSVVLDWADSTEGDLADTPYLVKRSETASGPYAPIALRDQSAYADGAAAPGTTYYYVVTATDENGNESPPSTAASATLQAPPETGPFALPTSPTPTATQEAIGMRAMFRDDPKGFNNHVSTAYDGAATQGERLWLGIGGVGYSYPHPAVAVEPDGLGGVSSGYVTSTGVLHDLPPLGTAISASGYPAKLYMSHEGTDMGAVVRYPDGSSAVHFLVMDGLGAPYESFRFVEEADGAQRVEKVKVGGVVFSSAEKHHALEATEGGMVVLHAHNNTAYADWPSLIVNRGDDADFTRPGADYAAGRQGTLKMGAVGDTVYVVGVDEPTFSVLYAVGADSAFVETRVPDGADFWGDEATITNGFGPTPRYLGPAAGNPGFVIYTGGTSRLDYHDGVSGSVIPVDEESAYTYQRIDGETWRVTYPDLRVQRLAALSVGPSAATPTWVTEADLDLPPGWAPMDVSHVEITTSGSVWLIGQRPATFPATGVTTNDIAVAYYRGGTP
jgi:fibronectin type 3 domain-containing protein